MTTRVLHTGGNRSKGAGSPPALSVVVTCHFEEKSIDDFYSRAFTTLQCPDPTHEIIFVDDGSTAGIWTRIKEIYRKDERATTIAEIVTNGLLLNALLVAFLVLAAVLSVVGKLVTRSFLALQHEPAYIVREEHSR